MIGKFPSPFRFLVLIAVFITAMIVISACGSVATPEWAADAQATRAALEETAAHLTEIAPTSTPTLTPSPTNTPIPPTNTPTNTLTNTPIPPTETPTNTPMNTPVPTETAAIESETGSDLESAVAVADPVAGMAAFNLPRTMPEGAVWSCSQCHSVTPDEMRLIGPGLWNVAVRGETTVEGQSALEYIYTSVTAPNDFVVPTDANGVPFPPNLMPIHYGNPAILSETELHDIIAYLLTLQ
jgi:hypothetical protein